MQNEMLSVMSLKVLREIAGNIQNVLFYTVMVDETTDCFNKKIFICWVDEGLVTDESLLCSKY